MPDIAVQQIIIKDIIKNSIHFRLKKDTVVLMSKKSWI